MSSAQVDSDAPRRVVGAIKRFQSALDLASRHAASAMAQEVADTSRELSRREERLGRARNDLSAARAALAACEGQPRADCSGPARAVAAAEQMVRENERRVGIAREVRTAICGQQDKLEGSRRRLAAAVSRHSEAGLRELSMVVGALDSYLLGGGGASSADAGGGARIAFASGSASAGSWSNSDGTEGSTGSRDVRIEAKVAKQMVVRGWDAGMIQEAMSGGVEVEAVNKATGGPATRYVHPVTGQSVVLDLGSGEVIHVGGPGFRYGTRSGDVR
jgi:hypothetical protein